VTVYDVSTSKPVFIAAIFWGEIPTYVSSPLNIYELQFKGREWMPVSAPKA
jgi:hypothetical protein